MDGQPSFAITDEIAGAFLARNQSGHPALLVPVTPVRPPLERSTGDIALRFPESAHFEVRGAVFDAHVAVIECANTELEATFDVLARDVASSLAAAGGTPTPQDVSRALARWEELLRSKRQLSREEEIGLWGELWMILQLGDRDRAVSVWRGPGAEPIDFVGGGIGIECKASFRRLEHFVSQEQVTRPLGTLEVYLQSLWVDYDVIAGRTVNDLIAELDAQLSSRREFEEKLLASGYCRADAHRYKLRLRLLAPPLLFAVSAIPRIQKADPGVSHIRYLASLSEEMAIPQAAALALTVRLTNG